MEVRDGRAVVGGQDLQRGELSEVSRKALCRGQRPLRRPPAEQELHSPLRVAHPIDALALGLTQPAQVVQRHEILAL